MRDAQVCKLERCTAHATLLFAFINSTSYFKSRFKDGLPCELWIETVRWRHTEGWEKKRCLLLNYVQPRLLERDEKGRGSGVQEL